MPPAEIFIVRHGERADHMDPDFAKTYPRPHDPPLTQGGVEMAEKLGDFMVSTCNVDLSKLIVLTSPLLRCVQTSDAIVRGALHASHKDDGTVPLFLEPSLAEGAYWMFRDMCNNPSLTGTDGFKFVTPIFRDAAYYHDNISKYVNPSKPFNFNADPVHCFDDNVMTEPNFQNRIENGAEALLRESFLDGKTVVLVAHGETTRLWCQALGHFDDSSFPFSPAYTAVCYMTLNSEGQWRPARFEPFTTPHLPAPPAEH